MAQLPLPTLHFPRTPSLTRSQETGASSDFEIPFKKALSSAPPDGKVHVGSQTPSFAEARSPAVYSFLPDRSQLPQMFVAAIKQPPVLESLLDYLPWAYFYALACTCRDFWHILRHPDLKDIVLARYVPGYQLCIESRDMQRFHDVPVSILHLDLLCEWEFDNFVSVFF